MQIEESDRWELFERLVREIGVGLLTSSEADGALHTRPLQTLRVTRDALWFFTDRRSAKAQEVRADVHCSVGYADPARHRFATASGVGRLWEDPVLARDLWQMDQLGYYPGGPEDPRLAVLEVSIQRAEYWLAPGRGAYYLAALRAALTGQRTDTIGENHKL